MRRLAFGALFLLVVVPLRADTLDLDQIIALMEQDRGEPPISARETVPQDRVPLPKQNDEFRLDQMIARATTNDVRLAPYASALKLAQYRSDASVQYENPELRLGTELNGVDPGQKASVRFYPPNPWQVSAEKGKNSAIVAEETAAYQRALLETTIEVMTTYHELQCLEKEEGLYDRLVHLKKKFALRVDEQVAASMGTQAQGLLALWEMQEALEERRYAEIQAGKLKQTLALLTGEAPEFFTIVALKEGDSFEPVDAEKSIQISMGHRPQLQVLRAQRAVADARLRGAKAAGVPWINFVEVGYRTRSEQWELEAGFELPFFTLGGTEKMLSYEALSLRNIEIEVQEQRLRFEVGSSVKAYNAALAEWAQLQDRQRVLIEQTRAYLALTTDADPKRMQERMSLEEKLIRAEFKMLDIRRRINQTHVELISKVGQPI